MTSEIRSDSALSRRHFLGATLLAGGSLLVDLKALGKLASDGKDLQPYPGGRLLKVIPFTGESRMSYGKLELSGLDGRLYTDLSSLSPDSLITAADKFYIRTSCPDLIDYETPWTINVKVSKDAGRVVPIKKIEAIAKDMGVHLMECAGNTRRGNFALMSACKWTGVPVMQFLKSIRLKPESNRICISGFDKHSQPSPGIELVKSYPGASWIFTQEQLESTGAFLATKMNGAPLPKDHGFPVRLVVPGWYGCTCIKWVNEIFCVDENVEATSQMKEFAERTRQDGVPALAREYKPAAIDQAAMPIRVEQWEVDGSRKYNVVGIMWGGNKLTKNLQIRFRESEPFVAVETYNQTTNATWTLWSHKWAPTATGIYTIQLKVADPTIPTRRLDMGYYVRAVEIT